MSHVGQALFGFHLAAEAEPRGVRKCFFFYEEGFSVTRNGGQGGSTV